MAKRKQATVKSKSQSEMARFLMGAALLVFITVCAYAPVFHAGFVWDDRPCYLENPLVRSDRGLSMIWSQSPLLGSDFPLNQTAFWLEHRFWGEHALGYHIANLSFHILASLLLWKVFARLKMPAAWLAAMLFAVHPAAVGTVAWVSEHKNTMSLMFCLISLLLYLRFDPDEPTTAKPVLLIFSLVAFVLAMLSKTSVVVFPVFLLLLAWWRRNRITRADLLKTLPFFAVSIFCGVLTMHGQSQEQYGAAVQSEGVLARLAEAGWALWFYLGHAFVPFKICAIYPRWEITTPVFIDFLPDFAALALLISLWFKRQSAKPWLMAFLCFGLVVAPVLGIVNMFFLKISRVADHLQYLSLIPAVAILAAILQWKKFGALRRVPAITLVAGFAILTFQHAKVYANQIALWRDSCDKFPACWTAQNNYAKALYDAGKMDEALEVVQKSVQARPNYESAQVTLANVLQAKGRLDEALIHYGAATNIYPRYALAHINMAATLYKLGRRDEALAEIKKGIEIEPDNASAYNNYGAMLDWDVHLDEAITNFQKAVSMEPRYSDAFKNLGMALARKGLYEEALVKYQKVLSLKPDSETYYLMGIALQKLGRENEAIAEFNAALEMNPNNSKARYQLQSMESHQPR